MSAPENLSRRDFLKLGGAGAALLAAGGALAACGSSPAAVTSTTAKGVAPSRPRSGGTLHAALSGGTSSDTLDAQGVINSVDFSRVISLYNSPVEFGIDGRPQLSLMESITPNATATEWVMRLRPASRSTTARPSTPTTSSSVFSG